MGFARDLGGVCSPPRGPFDSALALLEAVRGGAGLGNLPMSLAAGALQDGTLEELPFLGAIGGIPELSVFVVTSAGVLVPKVWVSVDHLMAELPRRLTRREF